MNRRLVDNLDKIIKLYLIGGKLLEKRVIIIDELSAAKDLKIQHTSLIKAAFCCRHNLST